MSKVLNEGFMPYQQHCCANDPEPFVDAAALLRAGSTIEEAYATLPAQHKTTLFHVENRPPLPMLIDLGRTEAAKVMQEQADRLIQP